MSINQLVIFNYVVLWGGARIRGCVRRWQQPLSRGPEWFFNVHVQPGFYHGEGKKILRAYWLRMLMPFAIEVPAAVAILMSGHYLNLGWLILGMAAVVHGNHLFSVDHAERQARRFAVTEDEQPVSSMVLSLQPRRLRDYTNRSVERFVVFTSIAAIAWLVRFYFKSPAAQNFRFVFGGPLVLLYWQLGFLIVKIGIVSWRTPVPQAQAEEHLQAREKARRFYLKVCDWNRIVIAGSLLFWPFILSAPAALQLTLIKYDFIALIVGTAILTVWQEVERNRVLKASLRARPMRMPDFLQTENSSWPLCYQPATPMLVIRGARGYSLNLANRLALLGTAYLAGMVMLFAILRSIH